MTDLKPEDLGEASPTVTRGLRYRLHPTAPQADRLTQYFGVARLVYNLAWEQRRDFWRQYLKSTGEQISFPSQCRELTDLRAAYHWIADVPSAVQVYALRDLDDAYRAFFAGRAGYPRARKKGESDSFRVKGRDVVVMPLNRKWAAVRLPKLGWVKFRMTRPVSGVVRNATVSCSAGAWHIAFATEVAAQQPTHSAGSTVGIDRGVTRTLTLSTGEVYQAPVTGRLVARRKSAQRALARARLGSKRRSVQRAKVACLHKRIASARTDWCHRTSTDIARRYGLVAVEDLKITNMTASAQGTVEEPGRNVRAKAGLNRSILDRSWARFATMLDYKLTERGGHLISVPAAYTSQTCASCGVVDARSRKSQAVFACVHCDHTDNADVNAAKEILRRSTAWLDVEGRVVGPPKRQSRRLKKREPTKPAVPGMLIGASQ